MYRKKLRVEVKDPVREIEREIERELRKGTAHKDLSSWKDRLS